MSDVSQDPRPSQQTPSDAPLPADVRGQAFGDGTQVMCILSVDFTKVSGMLDIHLLYHVCRKVGECTCVDASSQRSRGSEVEAATASKQRPDKYNRQRLPSC